MHCCGSGNKRFSEFFKQFFSLKVNYFGYFLKNHFTKLLFSGSFLWQNLTAKNINTRIQNKKLLKQDRHHLNKNVL